MVTAMVKRPRDSPRALAPQRVQEQPAKLIIIANAVSASKPTTASDFFFHHLTSVFPPRRIEANRTSCRPRHRESRADQDPESARQKNQIVPPTLDQPAVRVRQSRQSDVKHHPAIRWHIVLVVISQNCAWRAPHSERALWSRANCCKNDN